MSYKTEKLGEICEIIAGQSPPSNSYNKSGVGLPFFQGKADFGLFFPEIRMWCDSPQKIAKNGDILLSVRAPVGPTNICNVEQACIGRGLSAIRVKNLIDNLYLLYFLRFNERKLAASGRGSTFFSITQQDIKSIQIPLPPLETQKKIAEILDTADTLRQKDKALIEKYNQLTQSLFLEMFGDPVRNEKGWDVKRVIDVCTCIVPGRDKPKSFTGDIPWITTEDLKIFGITFVSKKGIGLTKEEITGVKGKIIPKGSVVMTCVGDLGVISIAGNDFVMNQQLHAFICSEKVNNVFLMYALAYQKSYMYKVASSTTVPYMNKTVCNSVPIICPEIDRQNKFSSMVEEIEKQKQLTEENLKKSEALFNGLLQKAFKGELV